MQYNEEHANRVIVCINRDVIFYRCYVILILRFPETILICVYSLILSRICLCKCVHHIKKKIWKLNGKSFVTTLLP